MAVQKNKVENHAGEQKQDWQKTGKELREKIADFLMKNFNKFTEDVKKLPPKERVRAFCDLLQFIVPKLKSIEDHGPFERMPDDQLDHIIDELKKAP